MIDYNFCPLCSKTLIGKNIEGKLRKVCPSSLCGFVFWDNPVPVVAAIVEHNGHVLLARNAEWPEGMFGLITGFLENDETPVEGVIREVHEEIGLKSKVVSLVGVYPFLVRKQIIIAYHVSARGEITLGDEIVQVKPVLPDKLRSWESGTGFAVRDWLKKRNEH
ncbi:NUDIX domain-containing protein [Spirochaetota bacterium]